MRNFPQYKYYEKTIIFIEMIVLRLTHDKNDHLLLHKKIRTNLGILLYIGYQIAILNQFSTENTKN